MGAPGTCRVPVLCARAENRRRNMGERFKKQQPIHLDLGCGKCTFLAKLAHREKDVNFIGIDISEDILGVARRNMEAEFGEDPVENVNLLSYNIEKLDTLFASSEKAARIYVNFCNPWQKARRP